MRACWAIAAVDGNSHNSGTLQTGVFEAQNKWLTGGLVPLSEQHLLNCTTNYDGLTNGCRGDNMPAAFDFIFDNRRAGFERLGLDSSQDYPNTYGVGECKDTDWHRPPSSCFVLPILCGVSLQLSAMSSTHKFLWELQD